MAYSSCKILPKCVTASSTDTYALSAEQMRFYLDNGYLVIKKLISEPALNTYRQRFVDVCHGRVGRKQFSVMKDHSLYKPDANPEEYIYKTSVFSTYSEDPRLLHIVSQLIGEDITVTNGMLINKPPGTAEHNAHQDFLYLPRRPANKIIGSWTAIDPVKKENGCLYMIPGSHKLEKLYDHTREEENLFFYITEQNTIAPEEKRMYLEMEPGDTVFFSYFMVHGSGPNISKTYRKCVSCHYVNTNCPYIDITGTKHEQLAKAVEALLNKKGSNITYFDILRIKSKPVRGVRSNL